MFVSDFAKDRCLSFVKVPPILGGELRAEGQ